MQVQPLESGLASPSGLRSPYEEKTRIAYDFETTLPFVSSKKSNIVFPRAQKQHRSQMRYQKFRRDLRKDKETGWMKGQQTQLNKMRLGSTLLSFPIVNSSRNSPQNVVRRSDPAEKSL